ncbi:MAG TPA: transcriptional regulator, partial [Mycobacteriales bacterium]
RAYQLVVDGGWVSRDAAADQLGVARSVAAFHLDKLIGAGLLEARYERTSGRTGPGAGRTAKLYGRSAREVAFSLPPRRYDLVGGLLADAVAQASSGSGNAGEALTEVARDAGVRIGRAAAEERGRSARRTALVRVLTDNGYLPRNHGREIELGNCPFHSLAERHPELVCRMNVDLLSGVLDGLGCADVLQARLEPATGTCCVRLGPR